MSKNKKTAHMSLKIIEKALRSSDGKIRSAAMNVCAGRDVPLDVIERGLKDSDWRVRSAAMNVCKESGIPIPVIRTIEPPELVFKKCVADVIVVAEIPKDAQVRGAYLYMTEPLLITLVMRLLLRILI